MLSVSLISGTVEPRLGGAFESSDLRGDVEARHLDRYVRLDRPRARLDLWITDASELADS